MPAPSQVFTLSESAYERGTEYDIVMLYQVLLGRNPENSTVIQDHRVQPLNVSLHSFVSSPEFRDSVLDPIANGGTVRRHDSGPRPSIDQLSWLFSRALLDEAQKSILRQASNWEQFFQYLCSLDGFLEPPPAAPTRPVRAPMPFKPNARLLAVPPRPPAEPPPAATPPGPTNAALMAKLDAVEAMLRTLLDRSGYAAAAPAPSPEAGLVPRRDPVTMDAAGTLAPAPKVRPSNRRQAR